MNYLRKKAGAGLAVFILFLGLVCMAGSVFPVQAATTKKVYQKTKVAYGTSSVSMYHKGATNYKSSRTSIATINQSGVVTPKKPGTTKITYNIGTTTYYTTLKLKRVKPVITVSKKSVTLDAGENETYQLNATATYGCKVYYKTNKKSVATVSSTGKITALKSGTATITVYGVKSTFLKKPANVKVKVEVTGAKAATSSTVDTYIPKSKEKYNMKVYTGTKTASAFLQVCKTVATTIVHDGNWYYSVNGSKNRNSFALARTQSRTASCAIYVSYCMQQFGTLPLECRISAKSTTNPSTIIRYPKNSTKAAAIKKYLAKYYKTIDFKGGKTVKAVDAAGKLKPGDILCYSYHMNVYAGKNSKGVRTWYDFGSKTFHEILTTGNRDNSKIVRIYRLK